MDISIVLIIENHDDDTINVVNSVRCYQGDLDLELIIIDHNLELGMWEWARMQEDLTYVYFEEPVISYGKMLNDTMEELSIHNHILLLDDSMLLMDGTIDKLWEALKEEDEIGIVAAISNQQMMLPDNIQADYSKLEHWLQENRKPICEQEVALIDAGMLIRKEILEKCEIFDEECPGQTTCLTDFSLRASKYAYKSVICTNAICWAIKNTNHVLDLIGNKEAHTFMKEKWGVHYFTVQPNRNVVGMIVDEKERNMNVLEIGCDCGANLIGIRNNYPNAKIYGCELNQAAVNVANNLFPCIQENIEDHNLPYEEKFFDYIVFADVLEHLRDPLEAVKYCKRFLKNDGHIIASIPNVMNISVIQELLKGNFSYQEFGLLDKTHIHMFTFNEIVKMFRMAGFLNLKYILAEGGISKQEEELIDRLIEIEPAAERHMYTTFQYLVDVSEYSI